jgi:hypothetical protein
MMNRFQNLLPNSPKLCFQIRRYTQVIDNGDGTYVANFVLYKIGTYTVRPKLASVGKAVQVETI